MAFIKKIWKDRISQFPNRRTINDGYVTKQVTVGRDEGTITEQGDAFDASNMNDLEQRIEDAYGDVQALVGAEVAAQYDQENVIFDPVATEGHGTGFVVSSDYIANLKASDLKDVNITSPTQGEALVFDNDGNLVNGTVSTVGNLDDLNDVDTTDKAEGDSLRYDGNSWVAKPTTIALTQAEYTALQTKEPNTHYVITDAPNLNATASDIEYSGAVTVKQAIDSKQDTLSTTSGTITANTSGGWAVNGWCKKYGNLVTFYIDGNKSSALASGWNTIGTLPAGFRPLDAFDFAMIDPGSDFASEGKVNTDGTVQVYKNSNSTTRIRAQATFII